MKKSNNFKEHLLIVIVGVVLFWGLFNYQIIFKIFGVGLNILSPVIVGAVIGLILNVPMSAIERNMFKPNQNNQYAKVTAKIKRPISLFLTVLICFGVIYLVLYLVIPALINTFMQLSEDVPIFVKKVIDYLQNSPQLNDWLDEMNISKDVITKKIQTTLNDGVLILNTVNSTFSFATSMISGVVNFVLGLVFAIYMLFQKEKLKHQLYKMTVAFLPQKGAKWVCYIANMAKTVFSKFLSGQCAEAIILGSLCCVGMSILRFPNAVTIGLLVAVTAFIPIVGAFIGVAVGGFLIMVTDFKQALWFVVFMIILQQVEGNLIYPKVVGQSVGLPSLWVLFAVTVGGSIGGILGMFISVPVCSVIYCLLREIVEYLNQKKGIIVEPISTVETKPDKQKNSSNIKNENFDLEQDSSPENISENVVDLSPLKEEISEDVVKIQSQTTTTSEVLQESVVVKEETKSPPQTVKKPATTSNNTKRNYPARKNKRR